MTKYFVYPFAKDGDKTPIPDPAQVDGSVSYDIGWGFDYERNPDPLIDPLTKDIPRDQTNQLFFDITENIKFLQDNTAVEWSSVRAAAGGYPKNARVALSGIVYISKDPANSGTPGVSSSWITTGETDPTLIAMAGTTPGANQFIYFTGTDTADVANISSFGRSFLSSPDSSVGQAILGIQNSDESTYGLTRASTTSETESGGDDSLHVSPPKMRFGFSISAGTTGHFILPTWLGGFGCRWSKLFVNSGGGSVLATWSTPFSISVNFAGCAYADGGSSASVWLAGQNGLDGYYVDHGSSSGKTCFVWAFGR